MSDQDFNIFIVDDDPISRHVLKAFLKDSGYTVTEFASGESILNTQQRLSGLILMDVEMPGINGIETCRRLKDLVDNQIRFIFISAHDNMETRLKAYDAGGSDYICKPYSRAELIRKVKVAEEDFHHHQGIMIRAEVAQQAAFSAISNLGENGILFDFLRTSHTIATVDELAASIRKAIKDFGLSVLLEIRHQGKNLCYSNNTECTPLEQAILEHARSKGRMVWIKECLVVNYDLITMVISGFDQEDEALVGRQRDHLAFIAEASNARIESLSYDNSWLLQLRTAMQGFEILCDSLSKIQHDQFDRINLALIESENFMPHIESMLKDLDLDELQKMVLRDEALRSSKRAQEYLQQESVFNEQLSDLVIKFGKISGIV